MSDGECYNCSRRFSSNDKLCRSCGKPKWLYRNFDHRPRLRLICEFIAAHERGRDQLRKQRDEWKAVAIARGQIHNRDTDAWEKILEERDAEIARLTELQKG